MANRLRLGLQVNTTQGGFRWSEIRDLARWDSLWTEDHLLHGGDDEGYGTNVISPWEAWSILGGASAA